MFKSRTTPLLATLILALAGLSVSAQPAAAPEPAVRAQLTARRYAVISAEIGAKIDRIPLREGASFKEGDVLLAFDDALQQAQVKRARASLSVAQRTVAANEKLLALKSIGQLELEISQSEFVKAEAELAYAETMLAKCRITAPFAGRIAELRVREKEFIQAGQPLFELIDAAVPELEFIAPSSWLGWVTVGQPLVVRIDETNRDYPAVVERIGAKVDPVSRTVKIVATLTGARPELIAGMSGSVRVPAPTAPLSP
jgi:RND family efflux transporter MFP subunit